MLDSGEESAVPKRRELMIAVGTGAVTGPAAVRMIERFGDVYGRIGKGPDVESATETIVQQSLAEGPSGQMRLEAMCEIALETEINRCAHPGTILRVDTAATKFAKKYCVATKTGQKFLSETSKGTLKSIRSLSKIPEVDPMRIVVPEGTEDPEGFKARAIEENVLVVKDLVNQLTNDLAGSEVPPELARLCAAVYDQTIEKFGDTEAARTAAMNAVAGTIVLRMVNPRVVTPTAFGAPDLSRDQRRTAVLVTKVMQNIANGVESGRDKEGFLAPFGDMTEGETGTTLNSFFERVLKQGRDDRSGVRALLEPNSRIKTGAFKNKGYNRRVKEPLAAAHTALEHLTTDAPLTSADVKNLEHLQQELEAAERHYRESERDKDHKSERDTKLKEIAELRSALDRLVTNKIPAVLERNMTDTETELSSDDVKALARILVATGDEEKITTLLGETTSRFAVKQPANGYFRGASVPMALMQALGTSGVADEYIHSVTDGTLEAIRENDALIEVEALRLTDENRGQHDLEASITRIKELVRMIINSLNADRVPPSLIKQCFMLYQTYLHKFGNAGNARDRVAGHVFIRFISPMVTNTINRDVEATANQKRTAILIGKILQGIANGTHFNMVEFQPFNSFVDEMHSSAQRLADAIVLRGAELLPEYTGEPPVDSSPPEEDPESTEEVEAPVPPPRRESRLPEDLVERLRRQDTPADVIFELTALQEEDYWMGFDMGKLGELWRTLDERIRSSDRAGAQSLATAVKKFDRFLQQCPNGEAVRILREKLTRPLVLAIQAK